MTAAGLNWEGRGGAGAAAGTEGRGGAGTEAAPGTGARLESGAPNKVGAFGPGEERGVGTKPGGEGSAVPGARLRSARADSSLDLSKTVVFSSSSSHAESRAPARAGPLGAEAAPARGALGSGTLGSGALGSGGLGRG